MFTAGLRPDDILSCLRATSLGGGLRAPRGRSRGHGEPVHAHPVSGRAHRPWRNGCCYRPGSRIAFDWKWNERRRGLVLRRRGGIASFLPADRLMSAGLEVPEGGG